MCEKQDFMISLDERDSESDALAYEAILSVQITPESEGNLLFTTVARKRTGELSALTIDSKSKSIIQIDKISQKRALQVSCAADSSLISNADNDCNWSVESAPSLPICTDTTAVDINSASCSWYTSVGSRLD
jgi:hypothetical protein